MSETWAQVGFAAFLAAMTAAVGWLLARVIGAREDSIELKGKVAALEARCTALEAENKDLETKIEQAKAAAITVECVREVIEGALQARDVTAAERRQAWDERLALKIQGAFAESVQECQRHTRTELERMVPRIVREVLSTLPK